MSSQADTIQSGEHPDKPHRHGKKSFLFGECPSNIQYVNKNNPFVHLHVHTKFSLLDGACHPDQIMDLAVENNMPAVAITDHGVMYGAVDFYNAARAKGIKPIIGCEFYVAPGSRLDRTSDGPRSTANHLVLLACDETGYNNLIHLTSIAHLEGFYYKPRIDKELLAEKSKGLIGLSACLQGGIASKLLQEDLDGAITEAGQYSDILGRDSFFLEVQDHGLRDQRKVNKLLPAVSKSSGAPLVATNDVHYLRKEHAAAHEVLLCLQTQTVMSDPKRMRYETQEFYMKTRAEMDVLFGDFPGAVDRTLEIAERCNFEFRFGDLHFPTFTVPDGTTQKKYLMQLGLDGVKNKYGISDPLRPADDREKKIMDRFNMEFGVIEKTGYVNYYLVVWDFVNYARRSAIPVGLRGSGGASLVAYAIGITDIDPLEYGLVFERFLNPERVSPPDFDIDFCQYRRGEVIEYVKEKYGRAHVAQIITFGSLGAKLVIRDIGRVLEIPYGKCDQLSKLVPDDPKITLRTALEMSPEFKKAYETDEDCRNILDYGFVLEGLYRNPGTHAAGVVIGEKPLVELIPLARDKDKEPVTQYTMEPLGEIGLLKMDFLGLRTLSVIQETIELVKKSSGIDIDLSRLPAHDDATYELFNRGDTVGVFQLESTGMRDLIKRVRIDTIEDLIAMIALYRPGPMNMLDDYVNRKTGKAKVRYDHPLLEPILKETYGVMLYQEQIQKAANVLAGYSLGQGDILRRAMSKKKQSEMDKQRSNFLEGCAANKINAKLAGKIFDSIAKFAGYGFNKSHSTAYAVVSYRTAYLKANHPVEFMSALLSSEMSNFEKLPVFIAEAEEMGLKMLPPDINESGVRFRPDNGAIRFGLAGIKNVGEGAAAGVVAEREKNGRFKSLVDFCARIDGQIANKKVIESLARCGAFDSTGMHRARVFNGIDFAMARATDAMNDRRSGQGSLFDLLADKHAATDEAGIPECEKWHESELLAGEKELLGIYMSGHPLTQYASVLERYQLSTVKNMETLADRTMTRVGGIVSSVSRKVVKASKESMAIVQIEDLDGSIQVMVFPESFQKFGVHVVVGAAILVCGEVSRKDDQLRLVAYEIYPLRDAPRYFASRVGIHIPATHTKDGILEKVRDIMKLHPGTTPVSICLMYPGGEKVFIDTNRALNVLPDDTFIREIEHALGEKSVYVATVSSPCLRPKPTRNRRNNYPKSP